MSTTPAAATPEEVKVSVPVAAAAPKVITLAGKVAIVTGASRGIGSGIALRLARDGAKVIVNYLKDQTSADAVVAAIKSIPSGDAIAIQADTSKSSDVDRLFAETKRLFGGVDIVIANAATFAGSTLQTTTNSDFDLVFDVNVKGVFYVLRAAANNIENNGRIVVLGSGLKTGTAVGCGAYAATKAAVEALANTAAQELGSRGITCNTIHPGPTNTDMLAPSLADSNTKAYYLSITPQKRLGTPADIGDAVALVVSESARWVSGQSIHVNGAAK